MAKQQRRRTKYPGVYYVSAAGAKGFSERTYYICYWNDGKLIEELAGNQSQDSMTAEAAAHLRMVRLKSTLSNNQQQDREQRRQAQEVWTFDRLWETYKTHRPGLKGLYADENRYQNHLKPLWGEREPKSLTPLEVDRLRLLLLETRRPGTVKNVLELLSRLVNFAAKKRLCEIPTFTIELPRVNNIKTEDLTAQQLARLLEVLEKASNPQVAHLMKLALLTGHAAGRAFPAKMG